MVKTKFARNSAMRFGVIILLALLFAGCARQSTVPDDSASYLQGAEQASADYYLQQMQHSQPQSRTNWQLLAIGALLQEGQLQQAQNLYQQLPASLNQQQQTEKTLLTVQMLLARQDYPAAAEQLATLDVSTLSEFARQRYWRYQIAVSQDRPSLSLLRALIALEPYLAGADKQQNIDATWQALSQMTPEQAGALVIDASEHTLRSWLDLQHTWFVSRDDPARLAAGIRDWQTRYPQNPATQMLPLALSQPAQPDAAVIERVALLLPLSGQGAVFSHAIEQGFTTAKNQGTSPVMLPLASETHQDELTAPADSLTALLSGTDAAPEHSTDTDDAVAVADQQDDFSALADPDSHPAAEYPAAAEAAPQAGSSATIYGKVTPPLAAEGQSSVLTAWPLAGPVAASASAQIKIYDTSSQPLETLLLQAQQDGASIVVGPLLKENVAALADSDSTLNILALNQPPAVMHKGNICYFALSPEDEARDAARHIWQQGQHYPLLLVPGGELGNRISQAFTRQWQALGGDTVLQQTIGTTSDLKQAINHHGGIALTGTPVMTQDSQAVAGQSEAQMPQGAVDAVYIIASPQDLTLIRSMISMRVGSRHHLAYYASSRSAQGGAELDYRIEMEGLQFSEIPMLAGANPQLMREALQAVNGDYSLARLYAMGVDAWTLASHFSQVRQRGEFTVNGNTGQITADQHCVLQRKLAWLTYHQGRIIPVE